MTDDEAARIKVWLVRLADAAAFSNGRQLLAIKAEIEADLQASGQPAPDTSVDEHLMPEWRPRCWALRGRRYRGVVVLGNIDHARLLAARWRREMQAELDRWSDWGLRTSLVIAIAKLDEAAAALDRIAVSGEEPKP